MSDLQDISVIDLPCFRDERGALTVAEFSKYVPFVVQRLFFIRDVPSGTYRGGHGHYRCRQYMICQSGRMRVEATDGSSQRTFLLYAGQSVLIEPGIFATETYLDPEATLLVLCDRPYEKDDYIHTIDDLVRFRAGIKGAPDV